MSPPGLETVQAPEAPPGSHPAAAAPPACPAGSDSLIVYMCISIISSLLSSSATCHASITVQQQLWVQHPGCIKALLDWFLIKIKVADISCPSSDSARWLWLLSVPPQYKSESVELCRCKGKIRCAAQAFWCHQLPALICIHCCRRKTGAHLVSNHPNSIINLRVHSLCHSWNYCARFHHSAFICISLVTGCDRGNIHCVCLTKILKWETH